MNINKWLDKRNNTIVVVVECENKFVLCAFVPCIHARKLDIICGLMKQTIY